MMLVSTRPAITPQFAQTNGSTTRGALLPESQVAPAARPETEMLRKIITSGDQHNRQHLAQKLSGIVDSATSNTDSTSLAQAFKTTTLDVHPYSAYGRNQGFQALTPVSLESFILATGLHLPQDKPAVLNLIQALNTPPMQAPAQGNLGGALSWPVPLSAENQHELLLRTLEQVPQEANLGLNAPDVGLLAYLASNQPLSPADLRDPAKALAKLLASPKALALGETLQNKMLGISTPTSHNDYLLAALNVTLDPLPLYTTTKNQVAGFDLAREQNWGKAPGEIVSALVQHLVTEGKATEQTAPIAAHLLLARLAPQYLVKDMPAGLVYGSHAWANLSIAAARLEAKSPGITSTLTFAQVMASAAAEPVSAEEDIITRQAQKDALQEWGLVNGHLAVNREGTYTDVQTNSVKEAFNAQLGELLEAAQEQRKPMPMRKEIALARLERIFGPGMPFEERCLVPSPREGKQTPPPNLYSILDVVMSGINNDATWISRDPRIPIEKVNLTFQYWIAEIFQDEFKTYLDGKEKSIVTQVKHMIAQLPLEDRKNLEFGKLDFYQEAHYQVVGLKGYALPKKSVHEKMLIKTERGTDTSLYEIDFKSGVISKRNETLENLQQPFKKDGVSGEFRHEAFAPSTAPKPGFTQASPARAQPPQSFSSERSQFIANTFLEGLALDKKGLQQEAAGMTTLDRNLAQSQAVENFIVNLIPLRSAIVNFQSGNYAEGAVDLSLDAFCFITAGAGAALKLGKVGASAASATSKALQAGKILGATAIGVLNPLSGVVDLTAGAGKLVLRGANKAANAGLSLVSQGMQKINTLSGTAGSYDLIKASRNYSASATGTFKFAEQTIESSAVLHNGKWFGYDPIKMQAFGAPLEGFTPKIGVVDGEVKSLGHFNSWLSNVVAPKPPTPELPLVFERAVGRAKAIDTDAYNRGHETIKPDAIPGYYPSMTSVQLQELVVSAGRTPEEIGSLVRLIEKKRIDISLDNFTYFNAEITKAGGQVTGMPQGFYLSQIDVLSEGECSALSNAMALAIQESKESILIENFFTAITNTSNPEVLKFRRDLTHLQDILGFRFHGAQVPRQVPYKTIISELADANASKTLMIRDKVHGLTAGVTVENNNKQWFYFDPNFGLAKFPTQEAMEKGLESALNSGRSNVLMNPYGTNRANPEYKIAEFDKAGLMHSNNNINSLTGLFSKRL